MHTSLCFLFTVCLAFAILSFVAKAERNLVKLRSLRGSIARGDPTTSDTGSSGDDAATTDVGTSGSTDGTTSTDEAASTEGNTSTDEAASTEGNTTTDDGITENTSTDESSGTSTTAETTESTAPKTVIDEALDSPLPDGITDPALKAIEEEEVSGDKRVKVISKRITKARANLDASTKHHLENVQKFEVYKDRISHMLRVLRTQAANLHQSRFKMITDAKVLDELLRERRLYGYREQLADMVLQKKVSMITSQGTAASEAALHQNILQTANDIQQVASGIEIPNSVAPILANDTTSLGQVGQPIPELSVAKSDASKTPGDSDAASVSH